MPAVDLSDSLFNRLQKLAIPLVDSVETVIGRLADFYEGGNGKAPVLAQPYAPTIGGPSRRFTDLTQPDLTHTKLLSARLNGQQMEKGLKWNSLMIELVEKAKANGKSVDEMKRLVIVNHVTGKKEDEGYRYLPRVGISIQGQDANNAARAAFHIARQMNWGLEVEFAWRNKEEAAYPGTTALMTNR